MRLGDVSFNDAFARLLFENLAKKPALAQRLTAIADRRVSPLEAFSPAELTKMLLGAALRGRFDAVKPFLATGKLMNGYAAELARRQNALRDLDGTAAARRR
jgi:hypothetical protein